MSDFIANIDDANTRIRQLESSLGLPQGEFIEFIEEANARIEVLERQSNERRPLGDGAIEPSPRGGKRRPTNNPLKVTGIDRVTAALNGIPTHRDPPRRLTGVNRIIFSDFPRK